jgi:hypothetical protein
MIAYSDLFMGTKFIKRFHYFGLAQEICQELENDGQEYRLYLYDENGYIFKKIRKFRIPRLQTNPT